MIVAVRETLRKHAVSATAVSGEKRARDEFSDIEEDNGFEAAIAEAERDAHGPPPAEQGDDDNDLIEEDYDSPAICD